ncbi:MAG: glycosyltransferase family 4 protein [Caldilineaceae bacterium SB0661_bin_32]|uniref:Glycosyltransferase family 4 protein n=1 Tax=Caldilineaceae bacterium SB0661_bin_32 TaxID=2605255 RepID=A0A6B1D9Y2_9CHLR|nr:glycosyltransferase family 4 protein [Caldilineaceae bacterium SB0661_bin_32]
MHIVVSGWFWGQPNTGSGQYLHRLLPHLAALNAPAGTANAADSHGRAETYNQAQGADNRKPIKYTLLLPRNPVESRQRDALAPFPSHLTTVVSPPPPLPRQLAKVYWEQVTVPRRARSLGADLLLVPYWAAPLWQPAPTVVTVHDLIPLLLPPYRGGWPGRLYTRLVCSSARRCVAVLTVSEASRRDIVAHLGLPGERVYAVHHGPNRESGDPERQEKDPSISRGRRVARKYSLPERYFLYLGGFDVRKNVVGIVHAYRRYLDLGGDPAVKLVVAGRLPRSDTAFFPDPKRLVRQLELTEHVRFIGWVEEADKAPLYAAAAAFLFPSLYEGFGMMLLEAMAAGTPVITSSE